ncbi:MAG: DegV family protein, partial [Clostridia bacterium]|nr:DegV family protein [Clostridia bacterium]
MNIKITADSTCDLSKELIEKYEIEIIPLYVVVDGKAYKDTVEIQQTD